MFRPSSSGNSRRSSASSAGRTSLAPLRVKQDNVGRGSNAGTSKRLSSDNGAGSSRSLAGNRKSISQKHGLINTKRQSSGYGGRNFGHEILKDTRPLSDKSYMQQEIRDIVDFLTQHNYPHPLNVKMLLTPSTKDFLKIFQFLYNFLEATYCPAQKFEEEVPQIFKSLKYPFNISKSSMFTVGSPHTWPQILGALHWLLNLNKYAIGVNEQSVLFSSQPTDDQDEFDSGADCEILFNYVEEAYVDFLEGADTFEEREEALAQSIKERSLGQTGNIEQLAAEEQRLAAELQLLQQEPCRLTALQEHAQALAGDNERFNKYLQELKEHKRIHQQKLQDIELQCQQAELELEQAGNEQQKLEHQLTHQELSAADVQRLHSEMRQLNAMLDMIERNKQEIDQEVWDKEKQIAKKQEQLEKHVSQFNSLARNLNLIPSTAENAHGIDFEMKLSFFNAHGNNNALEYFTKTIKPTLNQMKKQANEELHKLNAQKVSEEETLEQLTEMVESKQEEVAKAESRFQLRTKELDTLKEKVKEEGRQLAEEQSMLEAKLQQLQAVGDLDQLKAQAELKELITRWPLYQGGINSMLEAKLQQLQAVGDLDQLKAQAELKELITRYHEQIAEMQQEQKDYELFLLHACTKVLEHKAVIDERISHLDQQTSAMVQRVRSIEMPPAYNGS